MTGVETFTRWAPTILASVEAGDVRAAEYVRQAVSTLDSWDFPVGVRIGDSIIGALAKKLESPNRYRAHWSLLTGARKQWEELVWALVVKLERCASRGAVMTLGRAPACTERRAIQIIRLVPSVREFIRDDDNLPFSAKSLHDALKRVGLIKEDRRAWLTMAPIVQDVSPIGIPLTVFILRPVDPGLFPEAPGGSSHVHQQRHPPTSERRELPEGNDQQRHRDRRRRPVGARTADT